MLTLGLFVLMCDFIKPSRSGVKVTRGILGRDERTMVVVVLDSGVKVERKGGLSFYHFNNAL